MGWTKEQALAIDTLDKTLLVSAAAGSGKTATLTERIIQSILNDKVRADISRMLIVTYTNAAVDELRERIGKAIKKAAAEHPENSRLEEQLLRLKDARIMTITSFCNSILRSCADGAGLNPAYRIAEPAEAKIISASIMESLINAAYEGELSEVCEAEDFIALATTLSDARASAGLSDAFSYVYDKLESTEGGIDTLLPLIEEYSPEGFISVDKTKIGGYIMKKASEALTEYKAAYKKLLMLATDARLDEKNLPSAAADLDFIEQALECENYEQLREKILALTFKRPSKHASDTDTEFYLTFKQIRTYFSDDIKNFKASFFSYSTEEWQRLYTKLYKLLGIFYKFLKKFYSAFMAEKKRMGICEFSDIERYTYLALYDGQGERTALARELSEKFDYIYVDEYQDVNALQNKIFAAIAKENNRFMVGDIKQSIYGFRSARPEIFAEMKREFPSLGSDESAPCGSIFMSNNFRCDEMIVDFVNGIFDKMFGLLGDSIGYEDGDRLKFSKGYPEGAMPRCVVPEIHIIEKAASASGDIPESAEEVIDEAIEEDRTNAGAMARAICAKISTLLREGRLADGSPIEPRHIAILVRSIKGAATAALTAELKKIGISSELTDDTNLFMSREVMLALSFLYSIDNPRKDIYLAALMCSPLFSFSADEILIIRKSSRARTLWEALEKYLGSNPSYEKGVRFVNTLLRYKKLSEWLPTDKLIQIIYRESGLFALAARNGGRENLILLHSHAAKYEKSDFKGLYSFISYVNALIERGEKYPAASESSGENAVRIMTVHKSKGLEFPVCIIANASAGGKSKSRGRIVLSDNFAVAMKAKDDSGIALIENPAVYATENFISESEYDEELRVLYVALTRAREQLYVYGTCPKKTPEEYLDSISLLRDIISPYFATKARSFLDIILLCKDSGRVIVDSFSEGEQKSADVTEAEADTVSSCGEALEISADELMQRFCYSYPLSHLETLPEKISISKLSPNVLDDSEDTDIDLDELLSIGCILSDEDRKEPPTDEVASKTLPRFITKTNPKESAERGIATHMILQFCDLEFLERNGAEAELNRLRASEFISEDDARKVRLPEIDAFCRSELFPEMRRAKNLYRELRFNVRLPAERFTENEEKKALLHGSTVLIQGVIDCIIEGEDGSLHLIDYKTDRLKPAELENESLGEARLRASHSRQLLYYADAIEIIFGKRPRKVGVYSLHMGKEIEIT